MKEKIFDNKNSKCLLPFGVFLTVFVTLIVVWVMLAVSQAREDCVDLSESKGVSHGWKYELLTSEGNLKYEPEYLDNYSLDYGETIPQAVRISRPLSEEIYDAELVFRCVSISGIEVKLDESVLYSDYNGANEDKNGFLILNEAQKKQVWPTREIKISLPEDYLGQNLSVTTYFSESEMFFNPIFPSLENELTYFSPLVVQNIPLAMTIVFLGIAAVTLCVIYIMGLNYGLCNHKILLMIAFFVLLLIKKGSESDYSGFSTNWSLDVIGRLYLFPLFLYAALSIHNKWIKYLFSVCTGGLFLIDIINVIIFNGNNPVFYETDGRAYFIVMILFLIMLIVEGTIYKDNRKRIFTWQYVLLLVGVIVVCLWVYSREDGTITQYIINVLYCIKAGNYKAVIRLLSAIYTIMTVISLVAEYIKTSILTQKQIGILEERERYAIENYKTIQLAENETKHIRHEIRHHISMLYDLIKNDELEKAKDYIESIFGEVEKLPISQYCDNMVINAVVTNYLNRARGNGIITECEIHVPESINVRDEDLCILLTNMLENALESCEKINKASERYIRLKINADSRLFYISCSNSAYELVQSNEKGKFETTKRDKDFHGYGIAAMNRVAQRYYGKVQTRVSEKKFSVQIILQI